jgi:hypothetical protein
MKFELLHGLIRVSFELVYEGKPIEIDHCILDTGSAATAVDIDLIDINYRKPAVPKRLFGIGGDFHEVIAQPVDKVVIDGKELTDIEIEFGDIQAELGFSGFVGNDILSCFTVIIAYSDREIRFSK